MTPGLISYGTVAGGFDPMVMAFPFRLIVISALLLLTWGCASPSTEEVIMERLHALAQWMEEGKTERLSAAVSDQYHDIENRNADEIRRIIHRYSRLHRAVVVHLLNGEVEVMEEGRARVHLDAYLSSGAARVIRSTLPFTGRLYRFAFTLMKEGEEWVIRRARWRRVYRPQLLPGSRELLEQLFGKENTPSSG